MENEFEAFNINAFVNKLAGHVMTDPHLDSSATNDSRVSPRGWDEIGRRALAKSKRVPVGTYMYGSVAYGSMENDEELRIEHAKNDILKIVRDGGPTNIFRLIVNPDDFGQSVENLYHLSCLFSDGLCSFEISNEGEPVVGAQVPNSPLQSQLSDARHQLILEFDMATWRHAIDVFHITKATIPHRDTITR